MQRYLFFKNIQNLKYSICTIFGIVCNLLYYSVLLLWLNSVAVSIVSFVDRDGHTARDNRNCMRKIITRKFFAPGRHTIRFRYIGESAHFSTSFDYLEFVPLNIINDPTKPEDRH